MRQQIQSLHSDLSFLKQIVDSIPENGSMNECINAIKEKKELAINFIYEYPSCQEEVQALWFEFNDLLDTCYQRKRDESCSS